MVFNTDGLPLQGITGGYGSERRVEFILKDPSYAQSYYIEVSANGREKSIFVTFLPLLRCKEQDSSVQARMT